MYTVKTLPEFDTWLDGIKDRVTRLRLARQRGIRDARIFRAWLADVLRYAW